MNFAGTIEHLDGRQAIYKERVAEFSESLDIRNALFERAASLSELCEGSGQEHIVLNRTEANYNTTAILRADLREANDIHEAVDEKIDRHTASGALIRISNAAVAARIELPWEHSIENSADYYAYQGRKFTPFGVVSRAFSLRFLKRDLTRFGEAMDMLELAAADPGLNPQLAELTSRS